MTRLKQTACASPPPQDIVYYLSANRLCEYHIKLWFQNTRPYPTNQANAWPLIWMITEAHIEWKPIDCRLGLALWIPVYGSNNRWIRARDKPIGGWENIEGS